MRYVQSIKVVVALALAMVLLAAGAIYARNRIFDVWVVGNVQLTVSTQHPLQIFSGDRYTLSESGDTLGFGTVELDYWVLAPSPLGRSL